MTTANPLSLEQGASFEFAYEKYRALYEEAYGEIAALGVGGGPTFADLRQPRRGQSRMRVPTFDAAFYTYVTGRILTELIVAHRAVPPSKIKAFEKAYREFHRSRRPNDGFTIWFVKKLPSIQILLESNRWDPIGETSEQFSRVGKITIVNQSGRDADATTKMVQSAHDSMLRSGVPRVDEVLHGDVYIVGAADPKRTRMASYYPQSDTIKVNLTDRFAAKFLHAVIHEFGHRYWRHVFGNKGDWERYHYGISGGSVSLPGVGEPLDLVKGKPKVVRYVGDRIYIDENTYVGLRAYSKALRQMSRSALFPTPYASKNAEEHFCEAFALHCLGELQEPHAANFEAIVVNPDTSGTWRRDRREGTLASLIAEGGR